MKLKEIIESASLKERYEILTGVNRLKIEEELGKIEFLPMTMFNEVKNRYCLSVVDAFRNLRMIAVFTER